MKRKWRRTVAAALGLATLLAFTPAVYADDATQQTKQEVTIEMISDADHIATSNVYNARGHGQYLGFEWGDFSLQLERNGTDFQDGSDYLSLSKDLGTTKGFDLRGTIRLEQTLEGMGAEELALSATRSFEDRGKLGLLGVVDTNSSFRTFRVDYENVDVGSVTIDMGAQYKYFGDGEEGMAYGFGVRDDGWGVAAGLNSDESAEFTFLLDGEGVGVYSWTWQETPGSLNDDHAGMVRVGLKNDGTHMDSYGADFGYTIVKVFQSVPPFLGNESSMHETDADTRFEFAWAHNDDAKFAQFLAGKTLYSSDAFSLHGAVGPHYDDLENDLRAAWEVHLAKDGLFGRDDLGVYSTVRGLDLMDDYSATVGLKFSR